MKWTDLDISVTFMLLQQLVIELHHSLVLLELQLALAEVEAQRKTHLLQGLQVLGLFVHLQGREDAVRGQRRKLLKHDGASRTC